MKITAKLLSAIVFGTVIASCDPLYVLMVSNRTATQHTIELKALQPEVEFYENGDGEFQTGKLLSRHSLPTVGKFTPLTLPARQTLKVRGKGIATPKEEAIIINGDTIPAATFHLKRTATGAWKWSYWIEK